MGHYYNPNPPHLGAQQPLEKQKVTPPSGPPPQNPPFMGGSRVQQAVISCWTAAAVLSAAILPTLPPKITPPVSTVAQNPPFVGGARVPQAVISSWAEAATRAAAQLPTLNQKLVQPAGIVQCGEALRFAVVSANSGTVSTTITVPDDAQFVAVGWTGFDNTANFFSAGSMFFTQGGVDGAMNLVAEGASTTNQSAVMFWQVLPDTGPNKTLKYDWFGTNPPVTTDALCSVTFWKGMDTLDPVRADAGGVSAGLSPPYTSNTLLARSGDRIVAWAGAFVGTGVEGTADTWSGLTTLTQLAAAGKPDGAWATGYPSGDTTVALSTATNWQDGAITAISLKPAPVPLAVYPKRADAILYSHIPPPPPIVVAKNFNPALFGTVADNPPFVGASTPLAVQVAWIPPPPMPPVGINLDPPIAGPTPTNPPIVGASTPLAVSVAWIPPPPAPIVAKNLNPPITGPVVSNPPILGMRIPLAVSVGWIPPPPMPIVAINLDPPIAGPPVDNPPFGTRLQYPLASDTFPYISLLRQLVIPAQNYVFRPDTFPAIYASWAPQPYIAQVSPKYIPQVVASQVPSTSVPQAIYNSWIPAPYAPIVTTNLVPPISGPSQAQNVPPRVLSQAILNSWYVQPPMPATASIIAPLLPAQVVVSVNFTSFLLMGVG